MLSFISWLENFASHFGGEKNKWQTVRAKDLVEDPTLADEIFDLIKGAYKDIGGHVDLRSPEDITNSLVSGKMSFFKVIDVDVPNDPDAVVGFKDKASGTKNVVSAIKRGSDAAKAAWIDDGIKTLQTPGHYAEVSDALAGTLLKPGINVIEDENIVKKVLQRDVKWFGEFPEFEVARLKAKGIKDSAIARFKQHKGWYGRMLGDQQMHVKIMIGIPSV